MTRLLLATVCAALLLALAGCGGEPATSVTATSTAAPTTTARPTTTTFVPRTTEPTPVDKLNQQAIAAGLVLPVGENSVGDMVQAGCEKLIAAPDSAITILIDLLPSPGTYMPKPTADPDRVKGFQLGIPVLCPQFKAALDQAAASPELDPNAPETAPGTGTYDVGTGPGQLPPGKYRTTDVSDCYWERTSRGGEILDNQFATRAQEITVTIRKTDGSFTSRACGTWTKVG